VNLEPIRSAPELYAHALAIEREAAERYAELAQRMADLGNDAVAETFGRLAAEEAEHLRILERRTEGVAVPALQPEEFRWLDAGTPEVAARELVFRLMTPRMALAIALDAERRARDFFEHVRRAATDPALRLLAEEMAAEEVEHVAVVERLIERTPDPNVDWESVIENQSAKQLAK
jgi:rubrerythrin